VAGQAQALDPVAIEPAIFPLMRLQAAPEERPALLRVSQAAKGQRQGKTHRRRLVAMGVRRHVMQPAARQALGGEMPVEPGQAQAPGRGARLLPLELRVPLLQPRDMRPQRRNQRRGILALTESCSRGASFPAPRSMMCRSHTHD